MPERPTEITFRFLAEANDQNLYGRVHGGNVMKWIDQTGYACAAGWCQTQCVTVYVGGIRFHKPIHLGSIVEVKARLIYTGSSSMHVAIDVCAGSPTSREKVKTTSCIIVFSAIDKDGNKTPVPKFVPETEEERALERYAMRVMELRKGIEEDRDLYARPC